MKQLILSGGLGNQMFEYAFFLSCKKKRTGIKLNTALYQIDPMHNSYMLEKTFGVPSSYVAGNNFFSVFWTRLLYKYKFTKLVYSERPMKYDSSIYDAKQKYYSGVFINSKYFDDIKKDIHEAFIFRGIDVRIELLSQKMQTEESVSIHIRRGDYLNNPLYAVCTEEYYRRAIEKVNDIISTPQYYVFSDDPDWCVSFMNKFKVNYKIITDNVGSNCYKDMYLMSQCKHNIIANSTFSWWGAWLNNSEGKIVIAPNKWTINIPMEKPQNCWYMLEV